MLISFPATNLPRKIALDSLAILAAWTAPAIHRSNSSRRLIQLRLRLVMIQFYIIPSANLPNPRQRPTPGVCGGSQACNVSAPGVVAAASGSALRCKQCLGNP